ncbi:hypothetical protein E2C01_042163 [Portunus trituberculatus]|uniref:Uncharacterized protein n=1 Tax=Portunus trituberculatus TaxID=210409 RepID=A0A5B7FLS4_PORTR|nr:hypothetical protein [Portunus trituberculatus]
MGKTGWVTRRRPREIHEMPWPHSGKRRLPSSPSQPHAPQLQTWTMTCTWPSCLGMPREEEC